MKFRDKSSILYYIAKLSPFLVIYGRPQKLNILYQSGFTEPLNSCNYDYVKSAYRCVTKAEAQKIVPLLK